MVRPLDVGKADKLVLDAAAELDKQFAATDLAAKDIGGQTPKRGAPMNKIALSILRRRVMEAKAQGAVNIAVDVNTLVELMNGTLHGMDNGFEAKVMV